MAVEPSRSEYKKSDSHGDWWEMLVVLSVVLSTAVYFASSYGVKSHALTLIATVRKALHILL